MAHRDAGGEPRGGSPPAGQVSLSVGPVVLAPGVTRRNFRALLYASFVSIGMLAGMNILQAYVLTEHLQVAPAAQGRVTDNLAFWQELIARAPSPSSRRFARSSPSARGARRGDRRRRERLPGGILPRQAAGAVLVHDRGRFVSLVIAQIPAVLKARGFDVLTGGRAMFAVGILLAAFVGGRLFDSVGPSTPFVMIGVLQLLLAGAALALRLVPARAAVARGRG
jgi:hypothetical protein